MILGLDVGTVRTGVALSDEEERVAVGAGTLTGDHDEVIAAIAALVHQRSIAKVVVGLPLAMSGKETVQTGLTRKFVQQLQEHIVVPIILQDERLTSVQAERSGKGTVDERAAILILQAFLDRQNIHS